MPRGCGDAGCPLPCPTPVATALAQAAEFHQASATLRAHQVNDRGNHVSVRSLGQCSNRIHVFFPDRARISRTLGLKHARRSLGPRTTVTRHWYLSNPVFSALVGFGVHLATYTGCDLARLLNIATAMPNARSGQK
jgi:hypothetical protein